MKNTTLRILLFNAGYCTELDGSPSDYILRFYRYLYTPRRVIRRALVQLQRLVYDARPDICCFVEIHRKGKSAPRLNAYNYRDVENKYGPLSVLRYLPLFRNCCNGVFTQKPYHMKKRFLKSGTKKLLYDVRVARDTSLLLAHFSLKSKTRRRQFAELKAIIRRRKKVILCGDFNVFRGTDELRAFARECGLVVVNPRNQATFPAYRPTRTIDLFLCSPSIQLKKIEILRDVRLSDHLPVLVELAP